MTNAKSLPLPLSGIRVIELSIWFQGPMTGMLLGDLGAEVINLEKPITGTAGRGVQSMQGRSMVLPNGESLVYRAPNRNKKSISVDLRKEKSRDVLYRLVDVSDVLVSNLTDKALLDFGADYETIKKRNPNIIYAHGNSFGFNGPDAETRGQDTTGMARSGFLMNTPLGEGDPCYPVGAMSDVLTATMMAFGVVTALLGRERNKVSTGVETSQLHTMMWAQYFNLLLQANLGYDFPPFNRKGQWNPLFNFYKAQDGKWIAIGEYVTDKIWPFFCDVVGRPEWIKNPHFETEMLRKDNNTELIGLLEEMFASQPFKYWEERLAKINACFSLVKTTADVLEDPQVAANDYMTTYDDGLKMVSTPFKLLGTQFPNKGAPELAADLAEVMTEICGYTWEEVAQMTSEGLI